MSTHAALIDQLIADLEHDIEVTTERLRLAREMRATFDDTPAAEPEPEPAVDEVAERRRQKPKKKSGGYPCTECDKVLPTEGGMKTHRGRSHPGWDAKRPTAAEQPEPESEPADEPAPTGPDIAAAGRMFCCATCDAKTHTRPALARHTNDAHHRGLLTDEHLTRAVS